MKKKLTCPCCKRTKLRKHFLHQRKYLTMKKGDRIRFGLCNKCNSQISGNNNKYNPKVQKRAYRNCPEFRRHKLRDVGKHSKMLRDTHDQKYRQCINNARIAAKTKAIVRLEKLQGNTCAYAGREGVGPCNYKRNTRWGVYTTPAIDHVQNDGRDEPYEDTYRIALIVLKLPDDELRKRFQLMCGKHNNLKYHREDPRAIDENIERRRATRATWAKKPKRTHCLHSHELTEDNLNNQGQCKKCRSISYVKFKTENPEKYKARREQYRMNAKAKKAAQDEKINKIQPLLSAT